MPRSEILAGISKEMRGIEIAPWFNSLAPKREGFNCLTLDVFDAKTLRERAERDQAIDREKIPLIEDVDIVGSATEIASLIPDEDHGAFDYIVSSHNFEHLPNPIKFLQGCERVLKPGGVLVMAIPDARACFDFFRPFTATIDWLTAFREQRSKPSPEQVFQSHAYFATLDRNGTSVCAFTIRDSYEEIQVKGDIGAHYRKWARGADEGYEDAHCTVATPASFELLILETQLLGLVSMEFQPGSEPEGCEFYVRLVNSRAPPVDDANAARTALMRRMVQERLDMTPPAPSKTPDPPKPPKWPSIIWRSIRRR
jgi:SAM-dependent methyltransferase